MRVARRFVILFLLLPACATVQRFERGACAVARSSQPSEEAQWLKLRNWTIDSVGPVLVGDSHEAWAEGRWLRVTPDSIEVDAAGILDAFTFRGHVHGDTLRGISTQPTDVLHDSAGILVHSAERREWAGHIAAGSRADCGTVRAD